MTKILILAALAFAVAGGIAVAGGTHESSASSPEMPVLLTGL